MRRFLFLPLAALFIFVVATVAAFVYLPWYLAPLVSLGVFLGLILIARLYLGWMWSNMTRKSLAMMEQLGVVLRGAEVIVHGVESVSPPALPHYPPEDDDEHRDDDVESPDPRGPLAHYRIDMTIVPKRLVGSEDSWDARVLQAAAFEAGPWNPLNPDLTVPCVAQEVEFERDGRFVRPELHEPSRQHGRQRLRVVFGVPLGWTVLKLRYFNVDFGRIELPPVVG